MNEVLIWSDILFKLFPTLQLKKDTLSNWTRRIKINDWFEGSRRQKQKGSRATGEAATASTKRWVQAKDARLQAGDKPVLPAAFGGQKQPYQDMQVPNRRNQNR